MAIEDLEIEAVRARLRHLAALSGLRFEEEVDGKGGLRGSLSEVGGEESYLAVVRRGARHLSLSLALVVDEALLREHLEEVLSATSGFDVGAGLSRDGDLADGEVVLSLSTRLYLSGLTREVLELAIENLGAARRALESAV